MRQLNLTDPERTESTKWTESVKGHGAKRSAQGLFSHQRSEAGQAWRLVLDRMGEFRRPRRILRWVDAKSADRDLPMPRLRQWR